MKKKICGIQQIGIAYKDIKESWKWYRKYFGMNVPVFEDTAEAALMKQYTGNEIHLRHAILAMNMQGGAGFELWQFKNRTPSNVTESIKIGDLGIQIIKIKSRDIQKTYKFFEYEKLDLKSKLISSEDGKLHFYLQDPFGNLFEIIESNNWFCNDKALTGGVAGLTIGVSNINESLKLYKDILGYDEIIFDRKAIFEDTKNLDGGNTELRRVLLRHSEIKSGGFSKLLGNTEIELIERIDKQGIKIYKNRFWGDSGFIHVCFDVIGMKYLKEECTKAGFNFTVDSEDSFDMGEAAGHFSYIEDPDGTLIEFVETHKVPIIKKLGLYLNMKNRNPDRNLPDWMVKMLGLTKVKD
ncbi:MAG: VOC family protein [Bacteroidetes bacterium]|nr:VOC family protein [Bacteroidota bacterium]MBU1372512.1 VOC family protein [Bacteroidota bacterium]MBU1485079.1 VOC family protein [Bacteroidota bacterium]MBU1759539.1 VOC family protein [Bacteroidota bacterium]MBU2046049.1 VOC family protein [Bacteroidota bacterium]